MLNTRMTMRKTTMRPMIIFMFVGKKEEVETIKFVSYILMPEA